MSVEIITRHDLWVGQGKFTSLHSENSPCNPFRIRKKRGVGGGGGERERETEENYWVSNLTQLRFELWLKILMVFRLLAVNPYSFSIVGESLWRNLYGGIFPFFSGEHEKIVLGQAQDCLTTGQITMNEDYLY